LSTKLSYIKHKIISQEFIKKKTEQLQSRKLFQYNYLFEKKVGSIW
jgi:hypothetical protein